MKIKWKDHVNYPELLEGRERSYETFLLIEGISLRGMAFTHLILPVQPQMSPEVLFLGDRGPSKNGVRG